MRDMKNIKNKKEEMFDQVSISFLAFKYLYPATSIHYYVNKFKLKKYKRNNLIYVSEKEFDEKYKENIDGKERRKNK